MFNLNIWLHAYITLSLQKAFILKAAGGLSSDSGGNKARVFVFLHPFSLCSGTETPSHTQTGLPRQPHTHTHSGGSEYKVKGNRAMGKVKDKGKEEEK